MGAVRPGRLGQKAITDNSRAKAGWYLKAKREAQALEGRSEVTKMTLITDVQRRLARLTEPGHYIDGPLNGQEVSNARSAYRKPDGTACPVTYGDRRACHGNWCEGETGIYARQESGDYRWIPAAALGLLDQLRRQASHVS